MNKITRFVRNVAHFYKLHTVMTATHLSGVMFVIAAVNTFALVAPKDSTLYIMLPAINFMLLLFWFPQLYAAIVNGICFSDGLMHIPLEFGKDVHLKYLPRTKPPTGGEDPARVEICIDTPPAEFWGKDTEAELLVVFESTAEVRPRSQTVYLQKGEPTSPVYFQYTPKDSRMQRWQLSIYLVAPARQVLLLKQFNGRAASLDRRAVGTT